MPHTRLRNARAGSRRSGFTIVELLIVITIIIVLAALSLGAIARGYNWVMGRNTDTLIQKVAQRLDRRYEQLKNEAKGWDVPPTILNLAGGDQRRAKVLQLKLLVKWSFPTTYAEAVANYAESQLVFPNDLLPVTPTKGYPNALAILRALTQGGANFVTPALTPEQQSGACLKLAFERAPNSNTGELAPMEIGTAGAGSTDLNAFVMDAWGTPLIYRRHALQIISPPPPTVVNMATYNASLTILNQELLKQARLGFGTKNNIPNPALPGPSPDPDDPEGLLVNDPTWRNAQADWFVSTFRYPVVDPTNTSLPVRLYAPLVIISAGPDRRFETQAIDLNDNIDSYRLRQQLGDR